MGFDAFIEFIYSFFPMKQMERMRDAMSLSSDNREKDLETIRDSFETLLPWVGANFYYYRHLLPTVIRLIDRRQLDGVIWMPVFLECLYDGNYVADALFNANMAVKGVYAAPTTWACMHLFGNPYLMKEEV